MKTKEKHKQHWKLLIPLLQFLNYAFLLFSSVKERKCFLQWQLKFSLNNTFAVYLFIKKAMINDKINKLYH